MPEPPRKIIHVDMDCFYAAVEMRERPELAGLPVAVGGREGQRGVLTTCNYEARRHGVRSAMPTSTALRKCPGLVVLPVRFDLYRAESRRVRAIFAAFTRLVEPLSLDEAYLDVSRLASEGAAVAAEIRQRIREETGLTASAGIAPNKFLAKIASDWNKPDGQHEVREQDVAEFVRALPVEKIWGVGERTAAKLHALGAKTCGDLQAFSLLELSRRFGKFGGALHELCRGIDDRPVVPDRERKSLSNERTYAEDIASEAEGAGKLEALAVELAEDLAAGHGDRRVREAFVKLKFADFTVTTAQRAAEAPDPSLLRELLAEAWSRGQGKAVRLIGTGVRFHPKAPGGPPPGEAQLEMF